MGGEMSMDMNKIPFCQDPSQDVLADDLIINSLGGGPSAIGNNQDVTAVGGKKKKIAISLKKASQSTAGETDSTFPKESIAVESMNVKETVCIAATRELSR